MSLAIRVLVESKIDHCSLCEVEHLLELWDSNLAGAICEECRPFLESAELALVAVKCGHPSDALVFRNP